MSHEHNPSEAHPDYYEEMRTTDRINQGGLGALVVCAVFLAAGIAILAISAVTAPMNVYAIAGGYTVAGNAVTFLSLGVLLRNNAAAMHSGHHHEQCLARQNEELARQNEEILGQLAVMQHAMGMAAAVDLAHRRGGQINRRPQ